MEGNIEFTVIVPPASLEEYVSKKSENIKNELGKRVLGINSSPENMASYLKTENLKIEQDRLKTAKEQLEVNNREPALGILQAEISILKNIVTEAAASPDPNFRVVASQYNIHLVTLQMLEADVTGKTPSHYGVKID